MAQISSSGIASGLDVSSIVKQLVSIERKPIDTAKQKQIAISAKLSTLTALSVSFSSLKSAVTPLQSFSAFKSKLASSTDTSAVTATVNDSNLAVVGSSTVSQVVSLARAQKLASASFTSSTASVGTGTIKISIGEGSETAVSIDTGNASLTQIRDKINAKKLGVTASVLKSNDNEYKLVLQSTKNGTDHTIKVSVTDADGNDTDASGLSQLANFTETQSATDAKFVLDGVTMTRSSNVVTDAIDGVTLTLLKKTATDSETTINVTPNTTAVKENIEAFVAAYNEMMKGLNTAQSFDLQTRQGGPLFGNATAQAITKTFRLIPKERVLDLEGAFTSLSGIGITSQTDGLLVIDSTKLTMAIEQDVLAVGRVFSLFDKTVDASVTIPTSGVADRLSNVISDLMNLDTGRLSSEQRGLRTANDVLEKEVARVEKRVASFEKRMREKFAKLETSLSRIQGVGSALGRQITQLENLSTLISRRNSNSTNTGSSGS